MPQSQVEAANGALSKLGDFTITSLSDNTPQGVACNARLEICKRAVLRLHPWNFAIKRSSLEPTFVSITGAVDNGSGLVRLTATSHGVSATGEVVTVENVEGCTGNGTWTVTRIDANTLDLQDSTFGGTYTAATGRLTIAPNFDYAYRVALPSDCLRVLRVNDVQFGVDWRVEGRYIICHGYPIDLKYVYDVTDYTAMDILFYEALQTYLAHDICYRLNQSSTLKEQLRQDLQAILGKARFADATEDPAEKLEADDWVASRGTSAFGQKEYPWV